jgi:hypothetical protein
MDKIKTLRKFIRNLLDHGMKEDEILSYEHLTKSFRVFEIQEAIEYINEREKNKKKHHIGLRLTDFEYSLIKKSPSKLIREAILYRYT